MGSDARDDSTPSASGSAADTAVEAVESPLTSFDPSLVSDAGDDVEVTAPSGVEDLAALIEPDDELERGVEVGRYTILERVGAGGMGVVYAAFDPELDRKVALKVMHKRADESLNTSGGRERLLREAQVMAKLSHPNVITVHDVGTIKGRVFIAMEFIDGPTLRRWLEQSVHEWTEVVEVFVKAGRGLAAAHAVGLVHRDFKPDNVLIGKGGRVLVMDFGLARQAASRVSEAQPTGTPKPMQAHNVVLTRTGAVVGTPAYMAPEQHQGGAADPLVDQFSFCVALYEGLYGERPFGGNNMASLALNVLEGRIRHAPKGARVPPWLREIVLRGLSRDPLDRFPSMDALLAELQRDPPETRRPWVTASATVVMAGLVVGGYLMSRPETIDPCDAIDHHTDAAWQPERREAVRGAFSATGLGFADTSGQTTVQALDDWSERWAQRSVALCRAAQPEPGVDPHSLPGLRCLEVQHRDFAALTERLSHADAATVARAVEAVAALPDPAQCEEIELTLALVDRRRPESLEGIERLHQFRESAAKARVLLRTGAWADAARTAEPLLKSAALLQDPGLEAEAGLVLAQALHAKGESGPAERRLRQVVLQAAAGRRPRLEAEAWIELVRVVGQGMGLQDEGHRVGLAAEAAIVRAHDPPDLRARLSTALAAIELEQGRYDEAREHLERTIDQLEERQPTPLLALANAHLDLGAALDGLGRFAEAHESCARALAMREQRLGAQHLQVGAALARLGGAMLGEDLLLQADATLMRAQSILDPQHITADPAAELPPSMSRWQRRELATVLDRQGLLLRRQEELSEAEALHRRALALLETTVGPSHRDLGYPLVNLGLSLTEQRRPLDAIAYLRRALEILTKELDPEHPDLGTAHLDLANTLWALREYGKAREHYADALEIWEATLPEDHPLLAYALTGVGRCDVELGAAAAAIESLERALELRDHENEDRLNVAETSLVLARALWKAGNDPTRALELAVRARDLSGAVKPVDATGMQQLLMGEPIAGLTDQLVPAGLGATNRHTEGR